MARKAIPPGEAVASHLPPRVMDVIYPQSGRADRARGRVQLERP